MALLASPGATDAQGSKRWKFGRVGWLEVGCLLLCLNRDQRAFNGTTLTANHAWPWSGLKSTPHSRIIAQPSDALKPSEPRKDGAAGRATMAAMQCRLVDLRNHELGCGRTTW